VTEEATAPGDGTPPRLPMFPLSTVLFPGGLLPLHVFEPRYRAMVADCLAAEPHDFGVVLIARGSEVGGGDTRTDVGTVARIEALSRADDGRYALLARGTRRLRVLRWLPDDPYPLADVELLEGEAAAPENALREASAAVSRVEALLSELGQDIAGDDGPGTEGDAGPAWALCRRLPTGPLDRQRLLATDDPGARMALLTDMAGELAEDLVRLLAQG
jgi:Lon protease-like protein